MAAIDSISSEALADEIRGVFRSDASKAEALIENRLERQLEKYSAEERVAFLEDLTRQFKTAGSRLDARRSEELLRLLSLLLGRRVAVSELPLEESLEKLASSLNTVFDKVNQMVSVIRGTLLGQGAELETIRLIIGSSLEGGTPSKSLEEYLDQIKEAFVVAHRAFQQAARVKVGEILAELDPERIQAAAGGGFKFGPLRKAELFEMYRDRFSRCKGWFESGRFTEEVLREFEKICREEYVA